MKRKKALLLTSDDEELAIPLQQILEPHFSLETRTAQLAVGATMGKIAECITRSDAAVIFLTLRQSTQELIAGVINVIRQSCNAAIVLILDPADPDAPDAADG